MKKYIFLLFISVLILSCKTETAPVFPDKPTLKSITLSHTQIQEFKGNVILTLSYEDGDGDLGEDDPDKNTLWVKDSRLPDADLYHVQPLAPLESNVPIQGTLQVKLNRLFLLGNGVSEQVSFTVKIQDRSGKWSDEVVSPSIEIVK